MSKYIDLDELESLVRRGDFLITKNEGKYKGIIGNQIERKQLKKGFSADASKYTHVEVLGPFSHSVRVAPPKTKVVDFTKVYAGRYVRIMRYRDFKNNTDGADVAFWAASHCNLKYDWHGVIAFLSFLSIWFKQHVSKWFCSENAMWALQQVIYYAFGIKPEKAVPAHFYGEKEMELILEGRLPLISALTKR